MSEIPADIMDEAETVVSRINYVVTDPAADRLAIAEAILAERKRCASAYMHWARKMMEEVDKE